MTDENQNDEYIVNDDYDDAPSGAAIVYLLVFNIITLVIVGIVFL